MDYLSVMYVVIFSLFFNFVERYQVTLFHKFCEMFYQEEVFIY